MLRKMQVSVSSMSRLIRSAKRFKSKLSTERFLILNKVRVEINFGIRQTEVTAKQESFAGANFMGFSCLILAEFDKEIGIMNL